jgi:hypothetical protein
VPPELVVGGALHSVQREPPGCSALARHVERLRRPHATARHRRDEQEPGAKEAPDDPTALLEPEGSQPKVEPIFYSATGRSTSSPPASQYDTLRSRRNAR